MSDENDLYTDLLGLANSWQLAADNFQQMKTREVKFVKEAQERQDTVEEAQHRDLAQKAEIRSEVLAGAAKSLALKLGKWRQSHPEQKLPAPKRARV